MKTNTEMQLKVLDKMRENVANGYMIYSGICVRMDGDNSNSFVEIKNTDYAINFNGCEYRIKPETITINGVEIPKPLSEKDLIAMAEVDGSDDVFYPFPDRDLFMDVEVYVALRSINNSSIVYSDVDDAIEASKALFGIKR